MKVRNLKAAFKTIKTQLPAHAAPPAQRQCSGGCAHAGHDADTLLQLQKTSGNQATLHHLSTGAMQKKSQPPLQFWAMPGPLKTHVFDGEPDGDGLKGLHSQARKYPGNQNLQYEDADAVKGDKPYHADVRAKIGQTFYPKNNEYKGSDMFPGDWDEAKTTEAIEKAYDNKQEYRPGKKLGNSKGCPIIFVGTPPTTIYPHI